MGVTGLEPVTSAVKAALHNQLSHTCRDRDTVALATHRAEPDSFPGRTPAPPGEPGTSRLELNTSRPDLFLWASSDRVL